MAPQFRIIDKGAMKLPNLPISEVLPTVVEALSAQGVAVLQAPPGAGKTTIVPLAMLEADLTTGRILMLEPRRLAARAAAERMASSLGEKVGGRVGYRIRGESRVGPTTRIEVVTEGILTRMIQSDPELSGVGAVIFDEFHERSINADLGLALTWEARAALRPDLLVLVMSATLDAGPVAELLDAPNITSEGRAFPVETRLLERAVPKDMRFDHAAADLVEQAVRETEGGVLVFLPGEGEIRRLERVLSGRLPEDCAIRPLYGAMPFADQRAAIGPAATGRKIVLATSIAETSLTIEDIRVVVDTGQARRARFDPGSGMSRLVTERVSGAEADQRQGRAGRVAAGVCYRMWTAGQAGALPAFPPAEIEVADLAPLVLELAVWGATDTDDLAFLTRPNPGAFARAQDLLRELGALDGQQRITDHGRAIARLPLHPRLGHMLIRGGAAAAPLAALLSDRDPIGRGAADLTLRKRLLTNPKDFAANHSHSFDRGAVERIRTEAKRLAKMAGDRGSPLDWPALAALAYPDRIGLRRKGDAPRWILSGGKGAFLPADDPLCSARLIVATDLDGDQREAKIRQAIELSEADLRELYADHISWRETVEWSRRERRVVARRQECLGAIALADQHWAAAPADMVALAALDGIKELGLPISGPAALFRDRVELARRGGTALPDLSDATLMATLNDWLLPHIGGAKTAGDLQSLNLLEALRACLSWDQMQSLDKAVPAHFTTPMNRKVAIDYSADVPAISVRLQEMFGQTTHPMIAGQPIQLTLLSPAGRPLQTTMDLPGFWKSSYLDVRKDMRGRYPKHPWPEDPTQEEPTLRAKRRKDT